jgi:hypothetical protein
MDMTTGLLHGKGKTTKQIKAKQRRAERTVIKTVRAQVMTEDTACRMYQFEPDVCRLPLWWCHGQGKRRASTMRMAPTDRHDAAWTFALCVVHGTAEERRELRTEYLSSRMARGPMAFMRGPVRYEERA